MTADSSTNTDLMTHIIFFKHFQVQILQNLTVYGYNKLRSLFRYIYKLVSQTFYYDLHLHIK